MREKTPKIYEKVPSDKGYIEENKALLQKIEEEKERLKRESLEWEKVAKIVEERKAILDDLEKKGDN